MLRAFILALLLCSPAYALPIMVNNDFTSKSIGGDVEVFEDKSGGIEITGVLNTPYVQNQFVSMKSETPNFGYTDSSFWARINLNDSRKSTFSGYVEPLYLKYGYAQTDYVAIWCYDDFKSEVMHQKAGDHVPRAEWPLSYREPVFVIPSDARVCYLNVKTTSAVQLALTLYSEKEFNKFFVLDTALQSMYFGALLVSAAYNLLIAFSLRSKEYFAYTAFLLTYGVFQISYNGYGYALIWTDMVGFADMILPFMILMIGIASCTFTSLLLNLKKESPRFHKLGFALMIIIGTLAVLTLFAEYKIALMSTFIYSPVWAFFLLGSGCYLTYKGLRVAKIYLMGWWMFVIGTMIIICSRMGYLPVNDVTTNATQIATVLEFLLFSFALSDRINTTQRDLIKAQRKIAANLRASEQELETKVEQRTMELTETVNKLQSTQTQLVQAEKLAALGLLVSNVAHELNSPIASIVSSGNTVAFSVNELMDNLPAIVNQLDSSDRELFFSLIALPRMLNGFAPKEERAHTREVTAKLTELNVDGAMRKGRLMVRLNAHKEVEKFLPLLVSNDSDFILNSAAGIGDILSGTSNINSAVERVSRIIFSLKELAGTERATIMEETRLYVTMEKAIASYKHLMKEVNVIFNRQEIETIQCDPEAMQQVWTHLIINALHAMKYKGTLAIDLSCIDNQARVSIKDQGTGMTLDVQEHIFDAFYTTKTSGEGGGMGLTIVKKVVEQHRGHIEVNSEIGVGSTFTVYLPLTKQ
jgi:signal transduction histidine kinase